MNEKQIKKQEYVLNILSKMIMDIDPMCKYCVYYVDDNKDEWVEVGCFTDKHQYAQKIKVTKASKVLLTIMVLQEIFYA